MFKKKNRSAILILSLEDLLEPCRDKSRVAQSVYQSDSSSHVHTRDLIQTFQHLWFIFHIHVLSEIRTSTLLLPMITFKSKDKPITINSRNNIMRGRGAVERGERVR